MTMKQLERDTLFVFYLRARVCIVISTPTFHELVSEEDGLDRYQKQEGLYYLTLMLLLHRYQKQEGL